MRKASLIPSLLVAFLLTNIPFFSLKAEVKLPSIFTDNMVLQQQAEVPFWGWAEPGSSIAVTPSWSGKTYTAKTDRSGKWTLKVATPSAGGPYQVTISDGTPVALQNVLVGEVWVCSGQSNMEMPLKGFKGQPIIGSNEAILKSKNSNLRVYTVPRSSQTEPQENSKPSPWKVAGPEAVANFSATAYYFGNLLNEMLDVPVGVINVSYGGSNIEAWMNPSTLKPYEVGKIPKKGDPIPVVNRTPTTLYNGMLHPIIGYGMRGVIWYQGESNYDRPDQYEQLMQAMVKQWRSEWQNGEFPFYYAQIAPFNYAQLPPYNSGGKYNSAYVRDAQRKALDKIPNAGMAVLVDAGEENNIHPANKKVVGERLAYLALAKTYDIKGFGYASPELESMSVTGSTAELKFKNAPNGLTSFSKELANFEIAGENKVFFPAKAAISGSTVTVSSPQVKEPKAVRYAFKDFVVGDLFSTEGLPVSSFRTDEW